MTNLPNKAGVRTEDGAKRPKASPVGLEEEKL